MVSSMTKKTISLAISLLVVVISLTGVALGATAPVAPFTVSQDAPGFSGAPGKMARDGAGNFYVTDFWGKGIVKLDRQGDRIGFIPTNGRPSAVAVLPDNRLVVAVAAPQPKVSFYKQIGASGEEDTVNVFGAPTVALYRPVAITVDAAGKIYVLDSGDNSGDMNGFDVVIVPASIYRGNVKVYSATGGFLHEFGERTYPIKNSTLPGYFKLPQGIAYEKQNNQIVVADTQNGRLQYFTASNGSACTYVKSVGTPAGLSNPTEGAAVMFYNPVDVAFEYNDSNVLQRVYVAEKGKDQISVFDPATNFYLKGLNSTLIAGANMKQPSSILFERVGTGASTAGVVYVSNAAGSSAANVMSIGFDGGSVPVPSVALNITTSVPVTVSSASLNLAGTVSLANNQVSCSVNGGSFTSVTATGNNWSGVALTLASGGNFILCKTSSGAITTYAEISTSYVVAPPTPTVIISQPGAGVVTKSGSVTVTGTSNTANAMVHVVNGANSYTVDTLTSAAGAWSANVNLVEGSNLITVSIAKPGTATGTANVSVTADYTAPIMTVSFLNNGAITNEAVQNVDGYVTDLNLGAIEVNGVVVPAASRVAISSSITYFSAPVTLIRGAINVVTVKASDLAGNSATTSTGTVALKPEISGLSVLAPADNSYMPNASTAPANGTSAAVFTSVNAAGSAVTPSAGVWTTPSFSLTNNALNTKMFTASGAGVDTVTVKRTILNNASYAELAITSPAADLATNSASVVIGGKVASGSPQPTISIDGAAPVSVASYVSGTGVFSHTVNMSSQGLHSVKVIANAATTAVRNIIYDTALPEFSVQADSRPAPLAISGAMEPSAKMSAITATLEGSPVAIPLSVISFDAYDAVTDSVVWHANLNGYLYDTIAFTTIDPALNQKSMTYATGIPTGDIDADGTVRLADALACLRHVAGTEILTGTPKFQADVGSLVQGRAAQDGTVDITDAVLILNKAYGLMAF